MRAQRAERPQPMEEPMSPCLHPLSSIEQNGNKFVRCWLVVDVGLGVGADVGDGVDVR